MKLNNLQILRGISALLVCCFHFRTDINFGDQNWGELLFGKGSIGVPIFFVISGFIMVYTTQNLNPENSTYNVISFLKKRIIRIVPLYYLLTFAWMVLGGSFLFYFREDLQRLLSSLLFLPQKGQFPVLFLGWSLNYEMFFYTVFAFSLFFKRKRYVFIITFLVAAMIASKLYDFENSYLYMMTDFLNSYFLVGVLFALFLPKLRVKKNILIVASISFILLFAAYFFHILKTENAFAPLLFVSLFVLAFLIFDYFLSIKGNQFLIKMGDISYSIYLIHPFVGIVLDKFHSQSAMMMILMFIIKIFVVIILALISYEVIEKRFTLYLKNKFLSNF